MAPRSQLDHINNAPNGHSAAATSIPSTSYDPALLLNPKNFTPSSQNHNSQSANEPDSSDVVEFTFSSPNDTVESSNTLASDSVMQRPAAQVNGFGQMFERMNNVQDRAFAPLPKRRKLDDQESTPPRNGFSGGANGMLGQHIKDKRQEAARKSSSQSVEMVDLTDTVDDGDVVIVNTAAEEEVCYGMIHNAKLNCHIVPSPKPTSVSIMGATYWPIVKIVLNRKVGDGSQKILAYDYTRKIVGSVDPITSSGLAPLLDAPRLQLRTNCRIASRRRYQGEEAGKETSQSYNLDLVLYGPRKYAKPVGRHLSQKNIWLRKPVLVENGTKYENPQNPVAGKPLVPQQQPAMRDRYTTTSAPQMTRTVEEIKSEVMGVFNSLTRSEDLPEMEPHAMISTNLLKHQKQGLFFMNKKENPRQLSTQENPSDSLWQVRLSNNGQRSYYNVITGSVQNQQPAEAYGGILADMMGLGKTLSILSLVASTLDDAEEWSNKAPVQPQVPAPKKNGESAREFDVPTRQPLGLTKLRANGKATLLVCPLSVISNWEEQVKSHIKPDHFKYYIYHGSGRNRDARKLADHDLVITTYSTVSNEVSARNKGKSGPFPLEEIGWFRVVLDEAHFIREQSTLAFKAICRLQANRRWAVTGTPVQNKLDDLAALLAFLRISPFEEKGKFTQYINAPFKVCDPEIVPKLRVLVDSITLRRLKDKIDLPRRTDQIIRLDFTENERKLYQLFEQSAQDKVQVLAGNREKMLGGKTYIHILQSILRLRLISAHGRDLLNDTDLEIVQGKTKDSAIDLDSDEDDDLQALAESRIYTAFALMQETNNDLCITCQRRVGSDEIVDIANERDEDVLGYLTNCFHLLCTSCITNWQTNIAKQGAESCPMCQAPTPITYNEIRRSKAATEHEGHGQTKQEKKSRSKDGYTGYSGPHSKTRALLEDLLKSEEESEAKPDEPPFKSVVFSAWTSHLDLIQIALDSAGIKYTRLDGKMSRMARTQAMSAFREDDSIHVILVSISAGGLGLNLTSANNVYVMEPQYNPQAEAQAVDRVHRLGQERPVRTVRYIMRNSIEEKMLVLQEKKLKLANLSMDRGKVMDQAEAAKQKLMDLRDLFK
ncbi:SNF2 family N-terminal domain-containing protein [Xylariaceae sp. FL0016]|nr:SNF2 family N-terminal domain-containing protein [Xylariaceae sp. FL0016]